MDHDILKKAVQKAKALGSFKIITEDEEGRPFVDYIGKMDMVAYSCLLLKGWFFPSTLQNLYRNEELRVIVWDTGTPDGFELFGRLVMIEDLAYTNGLLKQEDASRIPHNEKQLIIEVFNILEINQGNFLLLTEEAALLR